MSQQIETLLRTLRETPDPHDAASAIQAMVSLGADAVEAVPAVIEKITSEEKFADLSYTAATLVRACGPSACTIALTCWARSLKQIKDISVLWMVVSVEIQNLVDDGADPTEAAPFLRQTLATVSAARQKKAFTTGPARRDPLAVAMLETMSEEERKDATERAAETAPKLAAAKLEMTENRLKEMLSGIEERHQRQSPSLDADSVLAFAKRAFKARSSIAIPMGDLGRLMDALVAALRDIKPDLAPGDAVQRAADAMILQCPLCGPFTQEATAHLVLAAKGAYKPDVIADAVVPAGPNVTKLVQGQCPKCAGTLGIVTIDPARIGIEPRRSGCFIVTAACGSPDCTEVRTLRWFRDRHLLRSFWGRAAVATYYSLSPRVADFIRARPRLRKMLRRFLVRPVVWAVKNASRCPEQRADSSRDG